MITKLDFYHFDYGDNCTESPNGICKNIFEVSFGGVLNSEDFPITPNNVMEITLPHNDECSGLPLEDLIVHFSPMKYKRNDEFRSFGNVKIHTFVSDGSWTLEELKESLCNRTFTITIRCANRSGEVIATEHHLDMVCKNVMIQHNFEHPYDVDEAVAVFIEDTEHTNNDKF